MKTAALAVLGAWSWVLGLIPPDPPRGSTFLVSDSARGHRSPPRGGEDGGHETQDPGPRTKDSAPADPLILGRASQGTPEGVQIERTVKRTTIDWLGRHGEIQRKEILLIKGSSLSITDLTFGERLIIRTDRKKVWKADPLARQYSELTFDEVAAARKVAIDELRAARARVPGTKDETDLNDVLEGLDQFDAAPNVALKIAGVQRDLLVNGDRVRISVQINPDVQAPGWLDSLAAIGAFHPAIAEKFKDLGGVPAKGTIRYVLFLDRVVEQFEVTSVKSREIADSEFDLPSGLRKIPLAGFERPAEKKPATPGKDKP